MCLVSQTIQKSCCEVGITKYLSPVPKTKISCNNHGTWYVAVCPSPDAPAEFELGVR
jgi:hypothetical protein